MEFWGGSSAYCTFLKESLAYVAWMLNSSCCETSFLNAVYKMVLIPYPSNRQSFSSAVSHAFIWMQWLKDHFATLLIR